ncbi:MAG: RluA family pseudouridine synthase [Bacteroidales bacterium]|nr:RluA family pseudouridine synthase [Bacteroidales bacterium]
MDIGSQIIYEDNHLIAICKKAGQIVQGDKTGDYCLSDAIKDYIKLRDSKPGNVFCGVIHRLDRPVSGIVVFAKTSKALSRMNQLVQSRKMQKTYWAITKNVPPQTQGTLHDWIVRNEKQNKSYVVTSHAPNAKEALLDYQLLNTSKGGYHLLEINLHTGRHHQIRCQLAHMGCPIKGDLKYGAPRSNPDGNISLHAYQLVFEHPVSHQEIRLTAPWQEANIFES